MNRERYPALLAVSLLCVAVSFGGRFAAAQTPPAAPQIALTPPEWSRLRAAYDYDAKRPLDVKEAPKENADALLLHITFTGPDGETVPGLFARPKADGVYPCALLLHGLTSDKETMLKYFGMPLVAHGVAVLALDAPHHGERRVKGENQWQPAVFTAAAHEGVRDYRRALDYLASRRDVDSRRVALLGYSLGSIMGSILGGVDSRIGPVALCVGGDPFLDYARTLPEPQRAGAFSLCSSLYIGHIAPRPLLMLNGKQDMTIRKPATDRLYAAAKEPKQIVWYDCGHILTLEAGTKAVTWVTEQLRADRR
jgi:fermentation-respiration switch protein FrsA (DUF1100 family)